MKAGGNVQLPQELSECYRLREGDELELLPELGSFPVRKPSRRDLSKFIGIARETALIRSTDEHGHDIRPH